jgi:hypothetical protein
MRFVVAVAFTLLIMIFVSTAYFGFALLAPPEDAVSVVSNTLAFICFSVSTIALSGIGIIAAIRELTPVARVDPRRSPRP